MIAVRVMGPMRVAVVGAPAYFARQRPPRTPDDLALHSCVQYRRAADGAMFEWPFERGGKSEPISVDGRIIVNDTDLAVRAAVDGLGIAYTIEAVADPFLRSGHTGSHVPYASLVELRAAYMPDAARAVSGHPPS
jgi:DNA-binding transcriptional LysR family regulator